MQIQRPNIQIGGDETGSHSFLHACYYETLRQNNLNQQVVNEWHIDCSTEEIYERLRPFLKMSSVTSGSKVFLTVIDKALCFIHIGHSGSLSISASGNNQGDALDAITKVSKIFPSRIIGEKHEVAVAFWSLGSSGPQAIVRNLIVPEWPDIKRNYTDHVTQSIGQLIESPPKSGGQLLLWTGPPGTGKTYAIRGLAWEWRKWCSIHYITDPEVFFGEKAAYMLNVLLGANDNGMYATPGIERVEQWRLLLLEDTGELLSSDAKIRIGQGLSRLLNVVDGLIGQGLRILIMITTNEEIHTLHPAVSRPGRAVNITKFTQLTKDEANDWLKHNGSSAKVSREATIAELYELKNELSGKVIHERKKLSVGFGANNQ